MKDGRLRRGQQNVSGEHETVEQRRVAGLDGLTHRFSPRDHLDRDVRELAVAILACRPGELARESVQRGGHVGDVQGPVEAALEHGPAGQDERQE